MTSLRKLIGFIMQILTLNIIKIGVKPVLAETEEDVLQNEAHMFSIFLMQPLVGVSLGLLAYNWYALYKSVSSISGLER